MKSILIPVCLVFFITITSFAENNTNYKETTNGISSGVITDNIINVDVNGMVCDFCAQSIEKVFMRRMKVKGINVNLEEQKVVIYLEKKTNIDNGTISSIFEDAGYTVEKIKRKS